MSKLLFGTAGIPLSTKSRNSLEGIKRVKELGLDGMELEFVHGVRMKPESAKLIAEERKRQDIVLTAHGPYYINLNADDKVKRAMSRTRILRTARIGKTAGARSITFHAGFYLKQDPSKVYETVKQELKKVVDTLKEEGNNIWIKPELTGKPTQFGDLKELIKLSQDLEQVQPCIDFAHYNARYVGKYNSYECYRDVLEQIEKGLGREALDNMHIHVSGINYGEKGEKNHLILEESDMKYKEMMKAWKEFNIGGIVISESPNIEEDALLMKNLWQK